MPREQMLVETSWTAERTFQIGEDFAYLNISLMDATGQPAESIVTDPNVLYVLVWGEPGDLDIIELDPRYTDKIVPGTRERLDGEEISA